MYKIYYLKKCIKLRCGKDSRTKLNADEITKVDSELSLAIKYLSTNDINEPLSIYSQDLDLLWKKFKAKFKYIEAAGGIVSNKKGQILLIYRNNKWDLPKGKLDKGETPEDAAIREVIEECGIEKLEIESFAECSYHIFTTTKNTVLKKTWWYNMNYYGNKKGTPQEEENIQKVKWFKGSELKKPLKKTYPIIKDLIAKEKKKVKVK
ncbi:MAG: NUDIX domain-containing protein [Bacteroidia bacterium]|nr:NUDIX domain-containing protein [Bacteroidia bacterium]